RKWDPDQPLEEHDASPGAVRSRRRSQPSTLVLPQLPILSRDRFGEAGLPQLHRVVAANNRPATLLAQPAEIGQAFEIIVMQQPDHQVVAVVGIELRATGKPAQERAHDGPLGKRAYRRPFRRALSPPVDTAALPARAAMTGGGVIDPGAAMDV